MNARMRPLLAVVTALVATMALVLAASLLPWFLFGVDGVLEPGRFDARLAYESYAVVAGAVGAVLGGRLCAAIGRSRPAVAVLALLSAAGGAANAFAQHGKPEPGARAPGLAVLEAVGLRREPAWFTLSMIPIGFLGVRYGGRRAPRAPGPRGDYVTTAAIRAAPDAVWRILTDAAGYADWNPEIVALRGRFAPGERISARVRLGNGAVRTVPMRVTAFEAPTRMQWTGGLPFGLFVGERTFTVQPRDGGAGFQMHLRMTGPLARLILRSVGDRQPEIDAFAAALKQRAERGG
jgi:uncharacterized protein YndB with AHSA1/START domain